MRWRRRWRWAVFATALSLAVAAAAHREAEAVAVAKKGKFRLVEALAESVAAVCLKHPQVLAVRVVADKPKALPLTQSVAVEILRRK